MIDVQIKSQSAIVAVDAVIMFRGEDGENAAILSISEQVLPVEYGAILRALIEKFHRASHANKYQDSPIPGLDAPTIPENPSSESPSHHTMTDPHATGRE